MSLPIKPQKTCATAWLEATKVVNTIPSHDAHNVIIDVDEPFIETATDRRMMTLVDNFLREQNVLPLQTVANTIFPEQLYQKHGAPAFYSVYERVYNRIKKKQGDWGRYFERMIRRPSSDGRVIRPLPELIKKMRQHVHGEGKTFRNIYELVISDPALELAIYDPERDAGPVMNRQCLSFLSFKLDRENRLMLTAMYRNHYYIQRLFGNLIGLARLMQFICTEVEIEIGPLTVVSTHAQIDTPNGCRRKDVYDLLSDCTAVHTAA